MIRLRLKMLGRFLSIRKESGGRKNLIILAIFSIFVLLTSRVSTQLFDTLRLTPEIGGALVFRVVAMAFLSFGLMLLFSSLVSAAVILYANPENELLFSLPVSGRKIFALRYIESMLATGWMVFLFGIPIAIGLGRSFVLGWDYVLVSALALFGLIILPTALGVFLLCAAYVWLPRYRGRALLFLLGVLVSYTCVSFAGRVDIGILFKMEFDPTLHLNAILSAIELPNHPYTPDTLAAQAMASMARREPMEAWRQLGILWTENAVGLALLMGVSYPLFRIGWKRHEQREVEVRPMIPFSLRIFSGRRALSLSLKDVKYLFRNISEWSQLLVLLTLIFVHIVNIRDLPLDQVYLKNFVSFVNLAVSSLLVVAVCVRFTYPTFSLEGKSSYLLKSMPLSIGDILNSKFWSNALPLLVLSQLLLFVSNRQTGVTPFFLIFSHVVSSLQTLTIVLLALHAALLWPPQGNSSLERAAGSVGGLFFMILGSLYVAGTIVFFTAPTYKVMLVMPLSSELAEPLMIMFTLFLAAHLLYFYVWSRTMPVLWKRS